MRSALAGALRVGGLIVGFGLSAIWIAFIGLELFRAVQWLLYE